MSEDKLESIARLSTALLKRANLKDLVFNVSKLKVDSIEVTFFDSDTRNMIGDSLTFGLFENMYVIENNLLIKIASFADGYRQKVEEKLLENSVVEMTLNHTPTTINHSKESSMYDSSENSADHDDSFEDFISKCIGTDSVFYSPDGTGMISWGDGDDDDLSPLEALTITQLEVARIRFLAVMGEIDKVIRDKQRAKYHENRGPAVYQRLSGGGGNRGYRNLNNWPPSHWEE